MKIYFECIPCFLNQALKICNYLKVSDDKKTAIFNRLMMRISKEWEELTPPEMAKVVYTLISDELGIEDLYKDLKAKDTNNALMLYDELKDKIKTSENPLLMALKASAYGNIIDYATSDDFNIKTEIERIKDIDFKIDDYHQFKKELEVSHWVLFLADNAGEIVFDKILMAILGVDVIVAVRDVPVLNDCIKRDAVSAGVDDVARIISSGCDTPGIILKKASKEFSELFKNAPIVISKGQGNYEGLSEVERPVYFLLTAKCQLVADHLGCEIGDMIFKRNM
jgi:hypothetical protein